MVEASPTIHAAWLLLQQGYAAARAVEDAFDAQHIHSTVPDEMPVGPERSAAVDAIPPEIWAESERLQKVRFAHEDHLLAWPSHNASAFAFKVFLCRGEGRDGAGYDGVLEDEARAILAEAGIILPGGDA